MSKIISAKEAAAKVKNGDTILFGGFYGVGTPENIVDELLKQGKKDLTIVSNDGGTPTEGIGKLIYDHRLKKFICSWCGLTPLVPELVDKGELELELTPQGTLVERIRAGGYGLGGILTKTGMDTMIEEKGYGKRVTLNGEDMLYHPPLRGNVTIVEAYEADEVGNLVFRRTQRNFCDTMCFSSDLVIASVVKPIKKAGEIDPDHVMVPGVLVDYIVQKDE